MDIKKALSGDHSAPIATGQPPLLIGVVSRLVNRAPDTIRSWEKNGEFKPTCKMPNGVRLFSFGDVVRLRELAASKKPGRPRKAPR